MVHASSAARWVAIVAFTPLVLGQTYILDPITTAICDPALGYCPTEPTATPSATPSAPLTLPCNPELGYCPGLSSSTLPLPLAPSPSCNPELGYCPGLPSSVPAVPLPCDPELGYCPLPPGATSTIGIPGIETPGIETSAISAGTTSALSSSEAPVPTAVPTMSEAPCICLVYPCECDAAASTMYTTVVHTITSCPASVTDCPYGSTTQSVVPLPTFTPCASAEECQAQDDACRTAPNANQSYCAAQLAECLSQHPEAPTTEALHTTIYTTQYVDVCPTGLTTKTYTLTNTCTRTECQQPTTHPANFAETTKVCTACPGQPTLTVTCPITSTALYTNGTSPPGTPVPAPAPAATPCNGANCPPAGSAPACNGANCPPAGSAPACNGANCPPAGSATTTGTGPYMTAGAAKGFAAEKASVLAVMGGVIGVFAWGL
ncbi:uncharacterized protein L3040_007895 [Drepanopeziza brunnea f. sp. 'multigermtubi']|uniref:Uncharacterized protein n=1 Tax=Marssonina brunnea f. sp. multigermtubi (strain MB_m1) TaxID=1072389 RepID=K1XNP4_MARBU|nr:uncharacterized protein MBM_07781 [Drepanopeziza brunnea f. sp. 'multigermtubi' MB_m1]EKD14104.1 hypothetical protein MBM_07781 [Drepanopeziza brunnea f. sp. 'multigermtubi' MB_m1]KAJ5035427.1 hypothetical protein L3040_007895 [Drepanopeziza brunnea f. sp. 'multigermtubi']